MSKKVTGQSLPDYFQNLESTMADQVSIYEAKLKAQDLKAKETADKIVNMINKKYHLELLTVDSAAMSEDIFNILKHQVK